MNFSFLLLKGEMIDRIEFHVGKAVEYVKAGTEDTRKALTLQREARRVSFTLEEFNLNSINN